jgi:hypothetical protein
MKLEFVQPKKKVKEIERGLNGRHKKRKGRM